MSSLQPAPSPWLRFQAYFIGLPKTGSTSLAWTFGNYRTRHEWQMPRLMELGLARLAGGVSEEEFWREAGSRLSSPKLEFDDVTCHWMYADLLAQHFPGAQFVWAVRSPLEWACSMMDMGYRQMAAAERGAGSREGWLRAMSFYVGGQVRMDVSDPEDPTTMVTHMLTAWSQHMALVRESVPEERLVVVRTPSIDAGTKVMARQVNVDHRTLRSEGRIANRAPARFDHLAACDLASIEAMYDTVCAPQVRAVMPECEAGDRKLLLRAAQPPTAEDWAEYSTATLTWAAEVVASMANEPAT